MQRSVLLSCQPANNTNEKFYQIAPFLSGSAYWMFQKIPLIIHGTRLYKVSYQAIGFDSASTYTIEYDMNDKPVRIQESYKNSYLNTDLSILNMMLQEGFLDIPAKEIVFHLNLINRIGLFDNIKMEFTQMDKLN